MLKLRSGLHGGRREACGRMKMASSQANVSMEFSCNFTQIQKSLSNLLAKLCFRASDESCRNKFSRCSRTWSANRAKALNYIIGYPVVHRVSLLLEEDSLAVVEESTQNKRALALAIFWFEMKFPELLPDTFVS